MLKILQARLQQYVNQELPHVQDGFRNRSKRSNCQYPLDRGKSKRSQENICFCFTDYVKAFDCVDHNKQWKIINEMGILDHISCLLRNLYASQEATVRTRRGTMDWLQIVKGVGQGYILSPSLFNLYAEYIMWNGGLDEV